MTALADAMPFAIDARRSAMAIDILEQVKPTLETSTHVRERTAGLAAAVSDAESARLTSSASADPEWRVE